MPEQVEVKYADGTVGYFMMPTSDEVQAEKDFFKALVSDLMDKFGNPMEDDK